MDITDKSESEVLEGFSYGEKNLRSYFLPWKLKKSWILLGLQEL